MKCVLCSFTTNEQDRLIDHYIKFHNVDKNNVFFDKLINQKTKVIYGRKCTACNEFVFSGKATHDFLKHYDKGFLQNDSDDLGNRAVTVTRIGDIDKFEITFKEHSSSYDFFDSVAVVEYFLNSVREKAPVYKSNVLIRAGFSIENIQQALNDNYTEPLTQNRYWSTEPIVARFFNDFVYFKIKESILKRVIQNRLSGSAWNFHKFNYINVKFLKISSQLLQ